MQAVEAVDEVVEDAVIELVAQHGISTSWSIDGLSLISITTALPLISLSPRRTFAVAISAAA